MLSDYNGVIPGGLAKRVEGIVPGVVEKLNNPNALLLIIYPGNQKEKLNFGFSIFKYWNKPDYKSFSCLIPQILKQGWR